LFYHLCLLSSCSLSMMLRKREGQERFWVEFFDTLMIALSALFLFCFGFWRYRGLNSVLHTCLSDSTAGGMVAGMTGVCHLAQLCSWYLLILSLEPIWNFIVWVSFSVISYTFFCSDLSLYPILPANFLDFS
jgi:hypothetical protein